MDEVVMAGSSRYNTANSSYYLYNGQYYWTMSPHRHYSVSSSSYAGMFAVYNDGNLNYTNVHDTNISVRPVINLASHVTFELGGLGTSDAPYIVQV